MNRTTLARCTLAMFAAAAALTLSACDKDVSSTKETTTKRVDTPEGTKTTTEKTEKKVETERKNPN